MLGKYSAFKEIEFVVERHKKHPEFIYYVMGFYIHTCPKMRYKGQYSPSELLCPVTTTWVPLEKCLQILDKQPFGCFNPEKQKELEEQAKKSKGKFGSLRNPFKGKK